MSESIKRNLISICGMIVLGFAARSLAAEALPPNVAISKSGAHIPTVAEVAKTSRLLTETLGEFRYG